MATVIIRIEQMYPERKLIEKAYWNDMGRTYKQLADSVDDYVSTQMNKYRRMFPEMTELRWEFADVGQGHYVQVPKGAPLVFVSRLTHNQLIDVAHAAIDKHDWRMLEMVAYQLKLMDNFILESELLEIPYDAYEFDWMLEDDSTIEALIDETEADDFE